MNETIQNLQKAVIDLAYDEVEDRTKVCLDAGIAPETIIKTGISEAMMTVGRRFETGEYFLADLVMAGEMVSDIMALLADKLDPDYCGTKGKVILATVKGDMHNLGKNLVSMMLSAAGFDIVDLGVDVHEDAIVQAVTETGARAVGLTMLLTPAAESIKAVVEAFEAAGLRDRVTIVIGGAACNDELRKTTGADLYGEDAVKAVSIFENILAPVYSCFVF